ncbi:EF hand family protein [Tritrichomonas foetus]|uniref:EF hand family protein n=1 Tax=Tritrichomonas foetus TaxID=1144522 RepID=A0A1J4KAB4_9EUKA|nr:EF hand family protein [Tritrichomonas foetus]|eukprot:OHT07906.1 EF hand family protein [Tritrichomonas foetus]
MPWSFLNRKKHFEMTVKSYDERVKFYEKRFDELDIGKCGKISRETVAEILKEQAEELDQLMVILLFEQFDLNNDKFIDKNEFVMFCTEMEKYSEREILRKIFDIVDTDHNQRLDVDEVQKLGSLMGLDVTMSDAWATVATLDKNHDNSIDFEEFCAIIGQL